MPDRCLNFRDDDEVRRLLAGASVVVRPFKVQPPPGAQVDVKLSRPSWSERYCPWAHFWGRHGFREGTRAPLAPGDVMVGREAWSWCRWFEPDVSEFTYGMRYRADAALIPHRDQQHARALFEKHGEMWLSPQTMPAALARIRRRVGSVEAREIVTLFGVWWDVGFIGDDTHTPEELALEWWLSRYGPDSWSGWVWVFSGLEEASGE